MAESFVQHDPEDLAEALEALARGEKESSDVLETLMRSRVFTLLDRPWPGHAAADDGIRLINVEDPGGSDSRMLGLFTSEDKAMAARSESPDFEHLARVEVLWAFLKLESGYGVVVNPNDEKAFRVPPEVASNLQQAVQQAVAQ